MAEKLNGKKVAFVVTDGFEQVELTGPKEGLEKLGAKIVKVICLVDRNQGADKTLGAYNYSPIFSLTDLGI